jgi:hypothetical protein
MRLATLGLIVAVLAAGCVGSAPDTASEATDDVPEPAESLLTPADTSASEVSVATNPTEPAHVVAAANSEGGFGVYVTDNASETWSAHRYDPEDVNTETEDASRFTFLWDPVVDFSPDGDEVYLSGLAYAPTSAVVVAVSTDGGRTFNEMHVVDESEPGGTFNDKEWMAVNPHTGTIHVAWQKEPALDQLRNVEYETGATPTWAGSWPRDRPTAANRGRNRSKSRAACTTTGPRSRSPRTAPTSHGSTTRRTRSTTSPRPTTVKPGPTPNPWRAWTRCRPTTATSACTPCPG